MRCAFSFQTKWLHIVSLWSSPHAGLDYNNYSRIMTRVMAPQRRNLNKLGTSDAWKVPVSPTPALIICPFSVNWLTDFLRLSLLIIKEVWQGPLLPLSLFFIHGHELLVAVRRGHRAKRVQPTTSLLLMSRGREITKIKDLRREGWGLA